MNINWDNAPAWANWYAKNRNGEKWWFSNKPKANTSIGEWVPQKRGHQLELVDDNVKKLDTSWWSESLTQRPK